MSLASSATVDEIIGPLVAFLIALLAIGCFLLRPLK